MTSQIAFSKRIQTFQNYVLYMKTLFKNTWHVRKKIYTIYTYVYMYILLYTQRIFKIIYIKKYHYAKLKANIKKCYSSCCTWEGYVKFYTCPALFSRKNYGELDRNTKRWHATSIYEYRISQKRNESKLSGIILCAGIYI